MKVAKRSIDSVLERVQRFKILTLPAFGEVFAVYHPENHRTEAQAAQRYDYDVKSLIGWSYIVV